jgi:hypothetical protein
MTTDSATKQLIQSWLQDKGFDVEEIPVSSTKTPDFLVRDTTHSYLLEVKDKFPDPQTLKERQETLEAGGVYEHQEHLSHDNASSYVISEAYKQLSTYKEKTADFKLVLLFARGLHPEAQRQRFEATLYGTANILDVSTEDSPVTPCYFFFYSDFFRFSDVLDGAVVTDHRRGNLCLNTQSQRYNDLKQSNLYRLFLPDGVIDPREEEAAGHAYIADWDSRRGDKVLTLQLLKQKYKNPNLLEVNPKLYSGEMRVPREHNDG